MDVASAENHRDKPGIFSVPTPVKKIFDKVPIVIYPPNRLPQRSSSCDNFPSLYVFSREQDAIVGKPSFNPSCLKWQTFLKIAGIDHSIIASNNHASPIGSLPFLLPALNGADSFSDIGNPIVADKMVKYSKEQGANVEEVSNMRSAAYQSLLDYRIRNAWLYFQYLESRNFNKVAYPLYVSSVSTNFLVRALISYQLRAAAESELLKFSSVIDIDDIYSEADKAFEALSILLGENSWFFGNERPSLFDASVFAYSHLLLDENMGWLETKLCRTLQTRKNLVQHRERILKKYYVYN
ncbi:putative mitochondrial outer membrane protein [Erysiphe necator]|uniref:Putative mitochondrial outer membrane protein n=1 Tax=Uncinula necator TaxID=52586 RepID=A0A0B1PG12_UNCNE|nr:putative mitochondrial outer membrane protein [Erysiphe necator]